jgi:predicted membrane protein
MSKMILALAAFVAVNVLLYLAFAFIVWELDPSQWNPDGRLVLVVFGVVFGGLAALGVKEMK